jgi:shikimate kinase
VSVVLLTGMSGAGKSTVLTRLAARGHTVVDTDDGDWIDPTAEPVWRADRVTALLDAHIHGHLFIAGTVVNQGEFYPRFDAVVLLTGPVDVLLARIAARTENPFGKDPADRARIEQDTAKFEPVLRLRATHVIDVRQPLEDVVTEVLAAADRPTSAPRRAPSPQIPSDR